MRKDLESEDFIQDASQQGSSNSRRCSSETTPLNLLHSSTSPKPTLYATPNQKKSKHSHLFPNRHEHLLNPHKHHIVKRLNDNEGKSIANLKESTPEAVQCVLLSPLPAPHSKLKSSQKGGESISEVSSSLLSLFSAIQPASPRMNSQNPSSLAPRNEEEILSTPARKTPSVTISFSCSPRGPLSVKENPLAQLGMGKYSVPSSLSTEGSSDSRQKEVYSVAEGLLQRPAECNVDWARRQIVQFLMQPSCRIFEKVLPLHVFGRLCAINSLTLNCVVSYLDAGSRHNTTPLGYSLTALWLSFEKRRARNRRMLPGRRRIVRGRCARE